MKKETIFAIVFGVLLGLIVAIVLIFVLRPSGEPNISEADSKLTPKTVASIMPLEIDSPSDREITQSDSIKISGKAKKDSLIIIESPVAEKSFFNKEEGFSTDFPLAVGENLITVRAYLDKSQTVPQIKSFRIYFLNQ